MLKLKKIGGFVFELVKWGMVIYLLWPLHKALSEPGHFTRIVIGILLFVLFSGKLFYDTILDYRRQQREKTLTADLLSLLATVVVISLIVGLVVFSIGMLIVATMRGADTAN